MSKKTKDFLEKMQEIFPSAKEEYGESIKQYGELLETVVIEDIFMPRILKLLLEEEQNEELLKIIFDYFEEIVNENDTHLMNVFSITVLEILGNDNKILKTSQKYMGPKTLVLQKKVDKDLGRL